MGRSPTGAVDQSQIRQPPRAYCWCGFMPFGCSSSILSGNWLLPLVASFGLVAPTPPSRRRLCTVLAVRRKHLMQPSSVLPIQSGGFGYTTGRLNFPRYGTPVEHISDRYEIMRYGGAGEFTHLTCSVGRFDHVAGRQLVALLAPGCCRSTSGTMMREAGCRVRCALSPVKPGNCDRVGKPSLRSWPISSSFGPSAPE